MSGESDKKSERQMPKDGQVMVSILRDMGINDFDPRVVNQMLEFSYRYVTNILEDARMYSHHAKKKAIDIEDVKLAVQMQTDQNFTAPPPREVLLDLARTKNAVQLPLIKPATGLRLPPDRHCLTACNYKLKDKNKPNSSFQYGKAGGGPMKSSPAAFGAISGRNKVILNKASSAGTPTSFSVVNPSSSGGASASKPVISINNSAGIPTRIDMEANVATNPGTPGSSPAVFKIQVAPQMGSGEKRKREDEDYDVA